ncbi:NADH-quinone oxidoreductase subunit NuoN [Methylophilaceae bacterium]|nr:NADH-quinone oxidoreductase subunit NuoN [Methylophilaceae bacterium]
MTDLIPQLNLLLPEIFIAIMAMFILLVGLFIDDKNKHISYGLSQFTLLCAGLITASIGFSQPQFAFNDMFIFDSLALFLKMMSYITLSIVFIYSKKYLFDKNLLNGEYLSLSFFALLGVMLMISSKNLLLMYMGLELLSLSLYALIALNRDDKKSNEAAIKYFVLGALASGLLLYGMSMLYGFSGSLDLYTIGNVIQTQNINSEILVFGLVFIVVGIAFKLGAVPFQMWVPDVYEGSVTPITMMISTIPKFAAVAMLIRFLFQGLESLIVDWQQMLLIMAILSMVIGNITAIAQKKIKRMLAYSTISHIGFVLLGFYVGTISGVQASIFYLSTYIIMTLAVFGLVILLSSSTKSIELIDDLKGLSQTHPWEAFLMMIVMFSLAGIPPTIGFYAKFSILQVVVDKEVVWPAIVAVISALIGMYYYLRIIRYMYFEKPSKKINIKTHVPMLSILTINAGGLLVLGIFPKTLMSISALAVGGSL